MEEEEEVEKSTAVKGGLFVVGGAGLCTTWDVGGQREFADEQWGCDGRRRI